MQLIFATFVLISFVEGKSVILHEDPILEVKHVDNQQHILSFPSGGVIMHQTGKSHISSQENEIKPVKDQNSKEMNTIVISENSSELHPNSPNTKLTIKQIENPSTSSSISISQVEPKSKTANVVISETNSQNVLPNLLDGEIKINARKVHENEEEPNDIKANDWFYTSRGTTLPFARTINGRSFLNILNRRNIPFIPSNDFGKFADQKSKAETLMKNSFINPHLPSLLGRGILSRRVYGDEDDYDTKGNDLFYSSKGRTFPLTRSFLNIDRNIYTPTPDFVKPTELDGGFYSRRVLGEEDDYDTKGSDLYYSSKGRTFPLTRSFDGRGFLNMNRRNGNLYIPSTDAVKSTEQLSGGLYPRNFQVNEDNFDTRGNELYYPNGRAEQILRTDIDVIPETNSYNNPQLLPSLLGSGINSKRIQGNEDDHDAKINDLYYLFSKTILPSLLKKPDNELRRSDPFHRLNAAFLGPFVGGGLG